MFILEMARNGMAVAARHAATETAAASRMAATGTATICKVSVCAAPTKCSRHSPALRRSLTRRCRNMRPPTGRFVQAGGAHADGALHPDLADAGVDVAVNGVNDVQDANHTDQRDQHPAEHFDLGEALRHLLTALAVGEPLRAGIIPAPAVQPCFKGGGIASFFSVGQTSA